MEHDAICRVLVIGAGTMGQQIAWQCAAQRAFFIPQFKKSADFVRPYVDRSWLGQKSGRGFYTYPNPAFEHPDFITAISNNEPYSFR
jgi:3-hydroxyacyl-CoA dehydrogenase